MSNALLDLDDAPQEGRRVRAILEPVDSPRANSAMMESTSEEADIFANIPRASEATVDLTFPAEDEEDDALSPGSNVESERGAEGEGALPSEEEDEDDGVQSAADNVIPPPVRETLRSAQQMWWAGFARAKDLGAAGIKAVGESEAYGTVRAKLQEANESEAMEKLRANASAGWTTVRETSAPVLTRAKDATLSAVEAAKPHLERAGKATTEAAGAVADATAKGYQSVRERATNQQPPNGGWDYEDDDPPASQIV